MKKALALYEVFDVRRPLMEVNGLIIAKNSKDAIGQYLKHNNESYIIRRSGSNYVTFSARKVIERDGKKYYAGSAVWYEIIQKIEKKS